MPRSLEPSEEYILAAFLSGELPDHLRQEIITYLAGHDRARDLLAMAQEAMDAAEVGDGSTRKVAPPARLAQSGGRKWVPTNIVSDQNLWKVTAFFAGAVLVLTIIVGVLALNTSRLQSTMEGRQWTPTVSGADVTLEWEGVPGAATYHIMQFDRTSGQASIIGRSEQPRVDLTYLTSGDLAPSEPIWVLALGPEGQFLDRSQAVLVNAVE